MSKRSRCGPARICLEPLWRRANSSQSRRALCGDRACRSALAVAPCDFVAREMVFGSCHSGLCACFRNPAVAGSIPPWSGLKIAAFKYKRSTCSVLQLRLENAPAAPAGKSQLLSTNVVHGEHSRSSGWKIAAFKYKNSTRSTSPQLRRVTCAEQLAQSNLRSALAQSTCTEQLAQTNLHRAHAQSACTEQLAQSTCAEQLAQSTCAEQLAQSTCVQQLAESSGC